MEANHGATAIESNVAETGGVDGASSSYVAKFTGHSSTISCLQVIDDAKEAGELFKTTYIFTGGYDHTARCFNAETGENLAIYRGHRSFIFTLRVGVHEEKTNDGTWDYEVYKYYLYTGSYDRTVRRWEVSTGACVAEYKLEYGLDEPRISPGIVQLLEVLDTRFFTVSPDHIVRAWRISDGEMAWEGKGHSDSVTGLQVRPGSLIETDIGISRTSDELYTSSTDKTVRVWDPDTGACKRVLRFATQPLYCLHVLQDGALFVGAGSSVVECDSDTGEARRSFSCKFGAVKTVFSDGSRVFMGTGFVSQQFSLQTGMRERVFAGHSSVITAVQVHDRTLYTTGDYNVLSWDTEPLLYSCMDGNLKLVNVLLSGTEEIPPVDAELKTGSGNSAIILAAKAGHSEIVESLLMYSADVHRMSRAGETCLHGASAAAAAKAVLALLRAGANPNFSTPSQDITVDRRGRWVERLRDSSYGHVEGDQTPLHYAARRGAAECCRLLITHNADANFKDSRYQTALMLACRGGEAATAAAILWTPCTEPSTGRRFYSDVRLRDLQGNTALKLAAGWECKRLVWKKYMESWAAGSAAARRATGLPTALPPMELSWQQRTAQRQRAAAAAGLSAV